MASDVIYNKIAIIERCIKRINEEYDDNPDNLKSFTKQDSIILNIQRSCEACIDLAMHIVSEKKLGIPQNSRDAFEILSSSGFIPNEQSQKLKSMIGFRNIAVHDYQTLSINIVKEIVEKHLNDFKDFTKTVIEII